MLAGQRAADPSFVALLYKNFVPKVLKHRSFEIASRLQTHRAVMNKRSGSLRKFYVVGWIFVDKGKVGVMPTIVTVRRKAGKRFFFAGSR